MKQLIFSIVLLLAAGSAQAQDLSAEMTAVGNEWKAAFERGDATALAALYAEKVEYVNAQDGSVTVRTPAEIQAGFVKTFESQTGSIEFAPGSSATLLPNGRVSFKGEFTQTLINKQTGEKQVFNGSFDHQVVKENGQWKLCLLKVIPKG